MARNKATIGGVRQSQLITTYGVGALVAVGDESFMVVGLDQWPTTNASEIHEPLLERGLGVEHFLLPPASDEGRDIPVRRFPEWSYCPLCRRLAPHSDFARFTNNECSKCKVPLVTSRFVVVCENGHIDDFPYWEWVHAAPGRSRPGQHELTIDARGVSASLRDIVIECSCGKSRSMNGAFAKNALRELTSCKGRRPWLGDTVECGLTPRTLQRGASNVYFSVVHSAISIPPWSEGAFKVLNRHWAVLKHIPESALHETIRGMNVIAGTRYSVEDLVEAARRRRVREQEPQNDVEKIRDQEYEALIRGAQETSREQDFVAEKVSGHAGIVNEYFDRVTSVTRLREVRVLTGFTRLTPLLPEDPPERIAHLTGDASDWLPAIEIRGEGVFLRLDAERLARWEIREDVRSRVRRIADNYRRRFLLNNATPDRDIIPRDVLIHTLAHVLITQWSLDSGYPTASLRERLYTSDSMAGLLIYTGTSDSAGSLGGVISQATVGRLEQSILGAMERTAWCSADPLCIEADAAGVDSLNLAACHACVLLPEVSCELGNILLDRALLVGIPEQPELGFFVELLRES